LILMRVTRFRVLVLGPGLTASPQIRQSFLQTSSNLAVLELGNEFSGQEAGEAAAGLLDKIAACLNSGSGSPS